MSLIGLQYVLRIILRAFGRRGGGAGVVLFSKGQLRP
jgi:hypothetical protein